jgi:hypothetical protein
MDFVAVHERVRPGGAVHRRQFLLTGKVGAEVLDEKIGHVHAEAVHAAVGPEAQRSEEVCTDLWVVPVPVRLFGSKGVQIPLPVVHPGPGRATESGCPVRRWQFAMLAFPVPEVVTLPCR